MEKQTTKKIISCLMIFAFVVSFSQVLIPTKTIAATNAIDWENPNKTGKAYNQYKFKITDVVNSRVAMQVVGCTGVVNKVSQWASKLLVSKKMKEKLDKQKADMVKKACRIAEKGATAAAGSIIYMTLDRVADIVFDCKEENITKSDAEIAAMLEANKLKKEEQDLTGCYNGIAITLAKNQLTAMTRSAVSWFNTGLSGDPLYVQSISALTNSIERNVVEPGTSILLDETIGYPYGRSFASSIVKYNQSRNGGVVGGVANALGELTSDLGNFITDPESYTETKGLTESLSNLKKAERANQIFAEDFSSGGWNGFLALTQKDWNNPLGFGVKAAQNLTRIMEQDVQAQKDEIMQNNGFLSQKVCVKWQWYGADAQPLKGYASFNGNTYKAGGVYNADKSSLNPNFDRCVEFKTITPGSIIKEKVDTYLSSPERQLEIADTINESLNAVFSVLLSKLESTGLSGISSEEYTYTDSNMVWTSEGNFSEGESYSNDGAYSSNFDLTRDLGNTYIYDNIYDAGAWNAKTGNVGIKNTATGLYSYSPANGTLSVGYNPPVYDGKGDKILYNTYYDTNVAGSSKLINYGYNGWEVGDRAFWNGNEWQNWKCAPNAKGECTKQKNPIDKRGVIQIQNDYVVAAKEILQMLPGVMKKLGELDYCIPGPNPSYKTNSANAQTAYLEWIGSMETTISGKSGKNNTYLIDGPGETAYDEMKKVYMDSGNGNVWKYITQSGGTWKTGVRLPTFWDGLLKVTGIEFLFKIDPISGGITRGITAAQNKMFNWVTGHEKGATFYPGIWYFSYPTYLGNGNTQKNKGAERPEWIDNFSKFVTNNLFQNFYGVFDGLMDKLYFKNITSMYKENEMTGELEANPSYIPMAEEGYSLTKDMLSYSEEITESTALYNEYIATAKANVGKLESIKAEVSKIIKEAQGRRDASLLRTLNDEAKDSGEPILSMTEYQKKYASCLDEENILYYDDSELMTGGNSTERCNNDLDDDLDGLVDENDPDCTGQTGSGYIRTGTTGITTGGYTGGSTTGVYGGGTTGSGKYNETTNTDYLMVN